MSRLTSGRASRSTWPIGCNRSNWSSSVEIGQDWSRLPILDFPRNGESPSESAIEDACHTGEGWVGQEPRLCFTVLQNVQVEALSGPPCGVWHDAGLAIIATLHIFLVLYLVISLLCSLRLVTNMSSGCFSWCPWKFKTTDKIWGEHQLRLCKLLDN